MKLTDNDIIKAFELCQSSSGMRPCYLCPVIDSGECVFGETYMSDFIIKKMLDLCRRLQDEKTALINGQETLQKHIAEQKAEIESLEKSVKVNNAGVIHYKSLYKTAKTEAYKECLKKFEKNIKNVKFTLGQTWEIQNALKKTLKEMVGEDNA